MCPRHRELGPVFASGRASAEQKSYFVHPELASDAPSAVNGDLSSTFLAGPGRQHCVRNANLQATVLRGGI